MTEKGFAEQVVERFSKVGALDSQEGLIDISVSVNKRLKDNDEVLIIVRWESEEAWKNWEKSDVHIQGHRDSRGKPKPEYIVSTTVSMYEVRAVRQGTPAKADV